MRRPMAVMGGVFFAGLFLLNKLPREALWPMAVWTAAVFGLTLCIRPLRKDGFWPSVFAVMLAANLVLQLGLLTQYDPAAALGGKTVRVIAMMQDLPQQGDVYCKTVLRTFSVDGAPMRCRLLLLSRNAPALDPAQKVLFNAKLYADAEPDSTGIFLRTFSLENCTVLSSKPDFWSRMLAVRAYTIAEICSALPGRAGAVLAAMVTGDASPIPPELWTRMRACGIVHIFSVSGLHLSVFSMLLYRALSRRRLPRWVVTALPALLVLFFMAVTGCSYSAVRAGIMLLMMLFGKFLFWRSDGLNALGFSMLLMGLFQPFSATDVGLLLSILGTFGVIVSAPAAEKLALRIYLRPRVLCFAVRQAVSAMFISACIFVLSFPVMAIRFSSVSPVSPLANAALFFAAEWAMVGAAVSVLLSTVPFLRIVSEAGFFLSGLLAKYCTVVADFFGGFAHSVVHTDPPVLRVWIAGVLILTAAAVLAPIPRRRKLLLGGTIGVLSLALCVGYHAWMMRDSVRVTVLDIGNQSAVLVESRGERALLGCGEGAVNPVLRHTDRLDLLLLPRVEATECADAFSLTQRVSCSEVMLPKRTPDMAGLFFRAHPKVSTRERFRIGAASLFYRTAGDSAAVYLQANGRRMLFLFSPGIDLHALPQAWLSADIVWARSDLPNAPEMQNIGLVLLSRSAKQGNGLIDSIQSGGILAAATAGEGELCLRLLRTGVIDLERRNPYA